MTHRRDVGPNGQRRVHPDSPDYPGVLRRCSNSGRPIPVTAYGSFGVLAHPAVGFFCSVRTPGDALLKTYDLARALRDTCMTVVGGFQSPMEREFLHLLLRGSAAAVVCPARGLGTMRLPRDWNIAVAGGRLLLLSFFEDALRRPTATIAAKRNAYVAALGDRLLVAHAEPGGKTEQLCRDHLAHGKQVFTLDSPDNAHLLQLGAVPVAANNPVICRK